LLEITFSRSVRPLIDNVDLVLLSRSYRFSGSKDPPLLEVLLPRSYRFLEVKSPIFRNSFLFIAIVGCVVFWNIPFLQDHNFSLFVFFDPVYVPGSLIRTRFELGFRIRIRILDVLHVRIRIHIRTGFLSSFFCGSLHKKNAVSV